VSVGSELYAYVAGLDLRVATNFRASHLLQLLLDLYQGCSAAGSEFLPESIEEGQMMPPVLNWHSTVLPK